MHPAVRCPVACFLALRFIAENGLTHVCTGVLRFLTPEDLIDFDAALDTFVNGDYYRCPVSAADIVDKVDALRHERQYKFYAMMLAEMLDILESEAKASGRKKRFSNNVLVDNVRMPWGKDGEECNCYAISLDALLRDTPPNQVRAAHARGSEYSIYETHHRTDWPAGCTLQYVKKFRPSAFKLMCENLPVTVFDYTPEILKDAINDFEGDDISLSSVGRHLPYSFVHASTHFFFLPGRSLRARCDDR